MLIQKITQLIFFLDNKSDYLNDLLDNGYNEVENLKLIFQDTERSKQFSKYLLQAIENRIK